jgi:hypothetical protein
MVCSLSTRGIAYGRSWFSYLVLHFFPRAYGRNASVPLAGVIILAHGSRGRKARGKETSF